MDKETKLEYTLIPMTIPDIPKPDEDGVSISNMLKESLHALYDLRLYNQKPRENEFDQMIEFAKRKKHIMTDSECKLNIEIIESIKEIERAMKKYEELKKKIVENTKHLQSLQGNRDREMVHTEADDVLEEVLELIGIHYDIPEIKELIQAYDKLEKWYS